MSKNRPTPAGQPVFHKAAKNLYRLESSDGYHALWKRGGKQFRRSFKNKDRKLDDAKRLVQNQKLLPANMPARIDFWDGLKQHLTPKKVNTNKGEFRCEKSQFSEEQMIEVFRKAAVDLMT